MKHLIISKNRGNGLVFMMLPKALVIQSSKIPLFILLEIGKKNENGGIKMKKEKFSNSGKHDIPLNVFLLAYKGYSKRYGTSQSAQRIREQCGFGIQEILEFISEELERAEKENDF